MSSATVFAEIARAFGEHQGGALDGVRVVELAHVLAGPAAGQIMADMGADVLKIEPPMGEMTRHMGPIARTTTGMFVSTNRSKYCVTADLRDPESLEAVRAVVAEADILVTNLDPDMLAQAGMDAETLRAKDPRLIHIAIGAGAGAARSTDGLVQAATGLTSITGDSDRPGYRTGASVVDVATGLWAALAALASLRRRDRTGRGDTVVIALPDIGLFLQYASLGMAGVDPGVIRRQGNHSHIACTPMLKASDGRIALTILTDKHWRLLCAAMGREDLLGDRRFETTPARQANQAQLEAELNPAAAAATRDEWTKRLSEAGLPVAPERSYAEILADPKLREDTLFVLDEEPEVVMVRPPARFSEAVYRTPALHRSLGPLRDFSEGAGHG